MYNYKHRKPMQGDTRFPDAYTTDMQRYPHKKNQNLNPPAKFMTFLGSTLALSACKADKLSP